MKPLLRRVHRYLAFGLALLWISQALTGLLMVFRWELDDASVAGPVVPLDPQALGRRITAIEAQAPGLTVTQLYASGGVAGRFDLYVDDAADHTTLIRVDGAGNVLRTRAADTGLIAFAATLHQTLLAGDTGKLILGLSGICLLSSILMGIGLAWPVRANQWRLVLWPRNARPGAARRYAWHRAAGLWLAVPAVTFISAGVLLTFESPLERWLGLDATPPELASAPAVSSHELPPGRALEVALARLPFSELSGAALPTAERPWYRIRVKQPGEWRRVYGTTVVFVSAADGRVLRVEDALAPTAAQAFMSNLYPVHTGEAAGLPGRLSALAVALWLLVMLFLGVGLWSARRRPRR